MTAPPAAEMTRDNRVCPADGKPLRFRGMDFTQQLSWGCPDDHLWCGPADTAPLTPGHRSWCRADHDPASVTCQVATTPATRDEPVAEAVHLAGNWVGWLTADTELEEIEFGERVCDFLTNWMLVRAYSEPRGRLASGIRALVGEVASGTSRVGLPFPPEWMPAALQMAPQGAPPKKEGP